MDISTYSVAISVIFFNLSVVIIVFLGRSTKFLVKYSSGVLLLFAGLSLIRHTIPLDNASSLVIHSNYVLPCVIAFLDIPFVDKLTVCHFVLILWLGGSIAFLFNYLLHAYHEIKKLKSFRSITNLQGEILLQELYNGAKLTVSPDAEVPKVSGIFRPHIYLPILNLSDEELTWVLNHELQHFRNRDQLIKTFYLVLIVLFWWNPLLHIYRRDLDNILELRCDAALTSNANNEDKLTYLQTILKVAKQTYYVNKRPSLCTSALLKCEPKSFVYQRFHIVIHQNTCKSTMKMICGLAVFLFCLSYFVIIQPAFQAPHTEEYLEFTPENAYLVPVRNGEYDIYYNGVFLDTVSQKDLMQNNFQQLQ